MSGPLNSCAGRSERYSILQLTNHRLGVVAGDEEGAGACMDVDCEGGVGAVVCV